MTVTSVPVDPSAERIDSLQRALKARKQSFCRTASIVMGCELDGAKEVDLLSPSTGELTTVSRTPSPFSTACVQRNSHRRVE